MADIPTRKRNAEATRDAILKAAQRIFSENGYDGAGMRDIASQAGIHAALVNRYFGTKEALFHEAILSLVTYGDLLQGDKATFGQRAAEYCCKKQFDDNGFDPTLAVIRSLGNPKVSPLIKQTIEENLILQFTLWLDGDQPEERAALIVAHLSGFDMIRRLIGANALSESRADHVIPFFAKTLQNYVNGAL